MNDEIKELASDDLCAVSGGTYLTGPRLMRGYVDSLKGFAAKPNVHDGVIANGLRGELPPGVTSKVRPWIGGTSIDKLTRPMQLNSGAGLPRNRW
jgi:hypothetical protein